jgi:hypothetical protein
MKRKIQGMVLFFLPFAWIYFGIYQEDSKSVFMAILISAFIFFLAEKLKE